MAGKFSSARDEMLWTMTFEGWANESGGTVESPVGYFARVSNSAEEIREIQDAFSDSLPEDFTDWNSIIGHFLLREDSNGFVYVDKYPTEAALIERYRQLESNFAEWESN